MKERKLIFMKWSALNAQAIYWATRGGDTGFITLHQILNRMKDFEKEYEETFKEPECPYTAAVAVGPRYYE